MKGIFIIEKLGEPMEVQSQKAEGGKLAKRTALFREMGERHGDVIMATLLGVKTSMLISFKLSPKTSVFSGSISIILASSRNAFPLDTSGGSASRKNGLLTEKAALPLKRSSAIGRSFTTSSG